MSEHTSTDLPLNGHAVDFLPWPPTPFTWSMFQAGWEDAVRRLANLLGEAPTLPVWSLDRGRVREEGAFWRALASHLQHGGPLAAQVLGVSPDGWVAPERKGRGVLGWWRRRPRDIWQAHGADVEEQVREVQRWTRAVRDARWSQADVLQVMEEIAPRLGQALRAWVVTSLALADAVAAEGLAPQAWEEHVRSTEMAPRHLMEALATLYQALAHDEEARAWLLEPQGEPPAPLRSFLRTHFWLSTQPFEAATPRWIDAPRPLVEHLARRVRAHRPIEAPPRPSSWSDGRIAYWLALRERVRVSIAQVVTGARAWVLAAAQDALEDGRLASVEEAFFLTLEELKQMATGEWNRAEQVQPHVSSRQQMYARYGEGVPTSIPLTQAQTAVFAPGWQPGWVPVALDARELVTTNRSSAGYGHLLAYTLQVPVREAREA